MESMERFTPLYGIIILYTIMNSMENLCFGKEDYFHILVFYTVRLFYKRINRKNFFLCSHTVHYRNTCGSSGELKIAWKHLALQFLVSVWKHGKYFLFLKQYVE